MSHFEDLSNELIYEIFEYLDYFHTYQAFFNLNQRFRHLLIHSTLPIKIKVSMTSKSAYIYYSQGIIEKNRHQITSLYLSDVLMYDNDVNATYLTSYATLSESYRAVITALDRIVTLKQLTELSIECYYYPFPKLLDILRSMPNIRALELRKIEFSENKLAYTSIRQSVDFQSISQTNGIINLTYDTECTRDQIELLTALFPRTRYFTTNALTRDLEAIIQFLCEKNNQNFCYLRTIHLMKDHYNFFHRVHKLIKTEPLFNNCTLIKRDFDIYLRR